MGDYEYDTLLNRARDRIPTDISERNRWTMPNPEILVEGNQTIIRISRQLLMQWIGMQIMSINI